MLIRELAISAVAAIGLAAAFSPQTSLASGDPRAGDCNGNVCVIRECNIETCEITTTYWTWNATLGWQFLYSTYEVIERYHLQK